MEKQTRVWFITGCSSGFGRALAETVLEKGEIVVLTARNPRKLEDLAASFPEQTLALQLDVTKPEQVRESVKNAIARFGRIDILVNNAGCEVAGILEEVSDDAIRRQFETNFFGVIDMLRVVIPYMRQQRSGHILNISSAACFMSGAGGGIYISSKLALEGISGSLANEVAHLGIKVTMVEPGAFSTDFFNKSHVLVETKIPEYQPIIKDMSQWIKDVKEQKIKLIGDPKKAALAMIKAVDSDVPPLRLALGSDAVETIDGALQFIKEGLDAWKEVSTSTDFDEVVTDKMQVAAVN
ncbi:SDR family NAD(P)-dependent oxidoreductase [Nostoc sp. FACHB-87]|uniref:oxidoreductase n=1 Tax=Nostocaceae TaxID=1162 RepID=UPI001688BA5D|nr:MULTISPECIES: oxidoreductase [Nostocaceae]MBD2453040.1 SDR family NAD(P)-dependent oxidoreductase [Nostoc sp. FACHB-87]MBD2475182.1 SDR family NAD(P)-dependent oxidoreductase [Anabaena sp. FACHB-83]